MSEIVKQLLSRSSDEAGIGWTPTTVVHVPAGLLHQAADEIDRLTAENEKLIQVQALLALSFPTEEDARHAEEWIAANPSRPLNEYPGNPSSREARLSARVRELEEALTPSAATKAAYIGEFAFEEEYLDEDGNEAVRKITVPWTTVKEIMAAIRARVRELEAGLGEYTCTCKGGYCAMQEGERDQCGNTARSLLSPTSNGQTGGE